jgi:hypothetical protein
MIPGEAAATRAQLPFAPSIAIVGGAKYGEALSAP